VTAVAPVVIACKGLWVGWTGLHDFDESKDSIPESDPGDKAPTAGLHAWQAVPVTIEEKLFEEFYNGCCNGTFWPLFHSMPDRAIFNKDHYKAYQDVNDIYARTTMRAIRKAHADRMECSPETRPDPPIVWVHDYHLMLMSTTIR
jgi:trehalose 6-phosphate synthase/phosphatase